ncbi:3409_t:CDS:2 [Diversispora eburnea]|uniref:3409_t:CDS:1 n=1 Tax=Diversispora eburnea TaxID=1213867 RepID=A0A9N8ZCB9_9GLOM|nr:3409_t:CDS:2 [Diversispora eburnea]
MNKLKYFILLFTILTLLNISTTFANQYKHTVIYTTTVTTKCPPKTTRTRKTLKTSCSPKPTTPKTSKTSCSPKSTATPKKLKTSCSPKSTETPKTKSTEAPKTKSTETPKTKSTETPKTKSTKTKSTATKSTKTNSTATKSTATASNGCGPKHENKKCPDNACCSKDGFCGDDVSFCGVECQSEFGHCFPASTDSTCGAKTNTTCPFNDCCSQTGFCGSTHEYCVPNCQKGYGFCGTFNDGLQVINTCTVKNSIALTFDDGPRQITNILLDKLKKHNIKATFFVNGNTGEKDSCIYDNAETLQRAFLEGHQIAAHTWSHPSLGSLSKEEIIYQIDYLEVAFKKILGTVPTYFRPPFGTGINVVDLRNELIKRNYIVALWDVDTRDWAEASVKDSENLFSQGTSDGLPRISLSHDRINTTVGPLADFEIKFSLEKSYKPMTLAECIGKDDIKDWYRNPPKFGKRDETWKCTEGDTHRII